MIVKTSELTNSEVFIFRMIGENNVCCWRSVIYDK